MQLVKNKGEGSFTFRFGAMKEKVGQKAKDSAADLKGWMTNLKSWEEVPSAPSAVAPVPSNSNSSTSRGTAA